MNKVEKLCLELEVLSQMNERVVTYGMDKTVAHTVASMEGENLLPYPETAYSNRPSITFRTASLEGIGQMIIQKLANVVEIIINLVGKVFKYIMSLISSDYGKNHKKQKDNYEQAKKYYYRSHRRYDEEKAGEEEVIVIDSRQTLAEIIRNHATEDLNDKKERLDSAYTVLVENIFENRSAMSNLIIIPKQVEELSETTIDLVNHVDTAIEKYAAGKVRSVVELTMQGKAKISMSKFLVAAGQVNTRISKARTVSLQLPAYPRKDEDFVYPHKYLRECITIIREASFAKSKVSYVNDVFLKGRDAMPAVDDFASGINVIFQKDEMFKKQRDFAAIKRNLIKSKKQLNKRGILPEEVNDFREIMLEYLATVTSTVNYSILYRQTNKAMMNNILRFINAKSFYLVARSKAMGGA